VEVEGVVLGATGQDLLIGTRRGRVTARFFHSNVSDLQGYLDAIVRVRGTVRAVANRQRQVQSVLIQVGSPLQLIVDQPAPADPFTAPAKRVSELREFDPGAAYFQRIRTAGQVVHVRDGVGYLMDGTNGMRFVPRDNVKFAAGDRVEVVGFPELEGPSPELQQAQVRVLNRSPLPPAHSISTSNLLDTVNDSTRVRFDANLLNVRTNQNEQVLELQTGQHVFQARLDKGSGTLPPMPAGSSLTLTGTYVGQGMVSAGSARVQSFELLLNSPTDVAILERPFWWTPRRAFAVVGGMAFVLGLAAIWITLLRRQVESRTHALRDEVESHKHTEAELEVKTTRLEQEIEERKRIEQEVEKTHRQLVDVSRKAGQAEVASSVLHNVGNVLNSVNVTASLLTDRVRKLRLSNVSKAAELMQLNHENLGKWMVEDAKGRQLPNYLEGLGRQLQAEQKQILDEVHELVQNVEHIKEIVAMQQNYARVAGVAETIALPELVENALKMETGGYTRHGIDVVREYEEVQPVTVDKHRVLQILVNLLHNAKYACEESQQPEKRVHVRIKSVDGQRVKIEVADNGVGIPPENMKRIFSHGFTTRKNGHGFGLHSSALAAKELGGKLSFHSDGPGRGASFTLEIPRESQAS
jgi:signal transduction histidine kinase